MAELLSVAVRLLVFALSGGSPGVCTGDNVQLVGVNSSQGRGELQYLGEDLAWAGVCSGAVGVIEAQIACQDLGYSFLSTIATVTDPIQTDGLFSITLINCLSVLQDHSSGLSVALTMTSIQNCDIDFSSNGNCDSTVYLECQNTSVADNALLVFTDRRQFWIIAPGIPLLTECRSEQFYCDPTIFVPRSSLFFSLFRAGQTCGTLNMSYFFNVVCMPREGDVCLLQSVSSCRGAGLVTFVRDSLQLGVCVASFGFLEAYIVCNELGLPKVRTLSYAPLSDYTLPVEVISVDCNGTEKEFSSCAMEVNNNCSEIADLTCGSGEFVDTVLVGVSGDSSAPFTVISPTDGVYVDDCQASGPLYCPGVYYMERTLPSIQDIITQLQASQPCSQLGPIDLSISCSLPIVDTTIIPDSSSNTNDIIITETRTNLPHSTVTASANNTNVVALASLSVFPIILLFIFVGGIALYVCYRHQQKRKFKEIIGELQTLHSLNKAHNEYARPSIMVTRPHRSVDLRRLSNTLSDGHHDDMEIPFGCLTLDKEIGSGAYGSIYHGIIACEHQAEPIEVAVKVLKKMATNSERRSLKLEIDMMKELGYHRHLVTMLAWSSESNKLALVMEYVCGGNLHDFLRSHRHKAIIWSAEVEDDEDRRDEAVVGDSYERTGQASETKGHKGDDTFPSGGSLTLINQLQFARQITLGMEYLASMKIVHRDLAARNVLVGEDQILKLADFGLSRDIKGNEGYYMKGVEDKLPVRWMAVESILDREFTLMSDVWAFGVVLWEIMTYAAFPFHHLTNREVISSVKAGERMAQPEDCPEEVYDIMVQCWNTDPLHRPLIRNVRMMLDELLDTGGYMCLMDNDDSSADNPLHVHCPMQMTFPAMQHSLPFNRNHTASHHNGHNIQSVV